MALLQLVYAPDPIFKMIAEPVEQVDSSIQQTVDDMFETMEFEKAVGMGANMVGILKQIAVVDLLPDGKSERHCFINPEITWRSEETQTFEERSLCFLGIGAEITRPKAIEINYLDYDGKKQNLKAEGFLATVIQHEVDYLNGVVFLDYLSKIKQNMLIKKMQKQLKVNPPHQHSASCNH